MSVDLLLNDATVVVGGREEVRSIGVKSDKIEGIYPIGQEPSANRVIDCSNLYVLPGMVDIHVHLRDLEQEAQEDYRTGTMAAAAGGVTTVLDMPNSIPPVLSRDVLDKKIANAELNRYVNVGFYAGIPKRVEGFDETLVPDILGLKAYPHAPLTEGTKYTRRRIEDCLALAKQHGLPLMFHPDSSKKNAPILTIQDHFVVHDCDSECESLKRFIDAKRRVDGRIHVCHVSCASAARLIAQSRAEDSLTAEVTPHHLLLSGDQFPNNDGVAKMLPPLRSPYDHQVLRQMLCDKCAIDCVASDHAPHTEEEKRAEFLKAASGIPGLETTVPLLLTQVFDGKLSWVDYLRVCCSVPAEIVGLSDKGVLAKGYDADIIVVSREEYRIRGDRFFSKAKITPFEGYRVLARPVMTIVGGEIVFSQGRFVIEAGRAGRVPLRKR
jgi:dihydroorotase (multifunctional complex type)